MNVKEQCHLNKKDINNVMLQKLLSADISQAEYFNFVNKTVCNGKLKVAPYVDQIKYTKKCDIIVKTCR